jgi:pimeloyl-ACP methyl ester carboxylesterase
MRFEDQTVGNPADPAIVLIHGAGNTMLSWDEELCERLAARGRFVVRYDMRGAGRAPAQEPFTLRDLVSDATGVLDRLGLVHAHVVGVSLGGAVAQLLALDHADRVAALTLIASTPGGPGHSQGDLPGITAGLSAAFAAEPPAPDWADRDAVIDYLATLERPFSPVFDEAAARQLAGRVFDYSDDIEASLTSSFEFDAGEPWRHRLGEIAAPTLVVHGGDDPLFPVEHGRALAAEIPGAELLVLGRMGHEYPPRHTWDTLIPEIAR